MTKRGLLIARDPRGCDVAHKAMRQSHMDPRERLCCAEVTRVQYLHIFILYMVIVYISIPFIGTR